MSDNQNQNNSSQNNERGDFHDNNENSPARRPRPMTAHGSRRRPAEGTSQNQAGASQDQNRSQQKYVEPRRSRNQNNNQFRNYNGDETVTDSSPIPRGIDTYNRIGNRTFDDRTVKSYNSCDNDTGHDFGATTNGQRGFRPNWGTGEPSSCFGPSSDEPSTSCRSDTYQESRSYVSQLSREETRMTNDTRYLLDMFIEQRAGKDRIPEPVIRSVCQADKTQTSFTDENIHDIALTLRRIGDEISSDMEFNRFIDQVPVESTQEIFWKVCEGLFKDGNMNWGRIVMVFYFAYRLIVRAVTKSLDEIPWAKQLLSWVVEFIGKYLAGWIISRGGWKMIKEWFGASSRTMIGLGVLTICAVLGTIFKNK